MKLTPFRKPATPSVTKEAVVLHDVTENTVVDTPPAKTDASDILRRAADTCSAVVSEIDNKCKDVVIVLSDEEKEILTPAMLDVFGEVKQHFTYSDYVKVSELLDNTDTYTALERFGF